MRTSWLALPLAAVLTATAAQAATVVQYRQLDSGPSLQLTNAGDMYTVSTIPGDGANVRFTLFDPNDASSTITVDGIFTFSAMGSGPAAVASSGSTTFAAQTLDSGTFSLIATESFTFLGLTGTNILSGTFENGRLTGTINTANPTVTVALPVSSIQEFNSDFFTNFNLSDFSITTSGATPRLSLFGPDGDQRLSDFQASSVGTFNGDDIGDNVGIVPEPATWAMMILGFGMVGAAMRRRSPLAA